MLGLHYKNKDKQINFSANLTSDPKLQQLLLSATVYVLFQITEFDPVTSER